MPARTSGLGELEPEDKDESYTEYNADKSYEYNGMQSLYSSVPVASIRMRDLEAPQHYGSRHLI